MAREEPKTVFMWAPSANMCWWQQQVHAEGIANVQGKTKLHMHVVFTDIKSFL
jgi:hypothetical protein